MFTQTKKDEIATKVSTTFRAIPQPDKLQQHQQFTQSDMVYFYESVLEPKLVAFSTDLAEREVKIAVETLLNDILASGISKHEDVIEFVEARKKALATVTHRQIA